jgi:hypothetical protein
MADLTYDEYDRIDAVRASRLKRMAASPLHYREQVDKETKNRGMLRAVHALALQPEQFDADFAVFDGVRRGAKYDTFAAYHHGKTILNETEITQARSVVEGLLRHPVAGELLRMPGECEKTITWTHPETGLRCKARLDKHLQTLGPTILDLKTYGTSDPRIIGHRVAQLGAHIQAAHYTEGLAIVLGVPVDAIKYLLVCAESSSPFDVAVVELASDNALALGRYERDRLMKRLAECMATNSWPGCCPEVVPLDLPAYADPLLDGTDSITPSEE